MSASELDFNHIYRIGMAFKSEALNFEAVQEIEDPEKLLRGEIRPGAPIAFRPTSGTRPQDLMGETHAMLKLVSERLIDTLLDERATGWSTFPVRLYGTEGNELLGYAGLAVTGRAGPIDRSKSRIELLPPPVPQGKPTYAELGMYFDPETWDGSDIFIPEGTSAVCVVERVKQALERRKLMNISFKPLTEYQMMLHSEYPKERASKQ